MHRSLCHDIIGNKLTFCICLDVILVTEVVEATFASPTGIGVFLTKLMGIIFKASRSITCFDDPIFLPGIALFGNFDKTRIYYFAFVDDQTKGFQMPQEQVKELTDYLQINQTLFEKPNSFAIGNLISNCQI